MKHRKEEEILRGKKFKIQSEVENWINKYDQEMEEKQNELDDILVIFNEETMQLNELETRYATIQREYEHIEIERAMAHEADKVFIKSS